MKAVAAAMTHQNPISLIETLLWQKGAGYALLDRHLKRLESSARFFGIPLSTPGIERLLENAIAGFESPRMRVRLLLDSHGSPSVSATALPQAQVHQPFRFVIADERVDAGNIYLKHKTTHRAFLDKPREQAVAQFDVDEVVFLNQRGELTEGSYTSLFLERDGPILTPAIECGLLPGTLRGELLATGKAHEALLYPQDLARANRIWLGNSVRGLMPAHWIRT
ncbi:aminotransferase class IV family protein [Pelagibacterium mangrovi]|uniref:aminotransferase class IV family protein n=1 Tax=Pelagibacterium mangrovi TaxID=3119828 RepID=UPI002FC6FC0C